MFTGQMPDITPGQIAALLTFIGSQAVAYGLLSNTQEQTFISIGGIVIAAAWKIADAVLRGQRAKGAAAASTPAAPIEPPGDNTEAPAGPSV